MARLELQSLVDCYDEARDVAMYAIENALYMLWRHLHWYLRLVYLPSDSLKKVHPPRTNTDLLVVKTHSLLQCDL